MCGIAGIISENGLDHADGDTMPAMLDRLAPRGPDGRGLWRDRHALLGHTRLAIIDPRHGHQPIGNEDESIWIVANGEIYNYRSLRHRLESQGHRFRTQTDTETILHLYEQVGPACTEQLRGMFAFAIWDAGRRTLLLARDPIGVKPLYYARCPGRLIFASTLTAVIEHPSVARAIDLESLHNYLTYHYVPSPRTILGGVSKLRPAERLCFKNGAIGTQTYWDMSFESDDGVADDEWLSLLRDGLEDAVHANLVADVPLGAFLSGGLDSSAVVGIMARTTPDPVCTNTVGFGDHRFDERDDARALARTLGCAHHDQLVHPDPVDIAERLPQCFDEPFADPSAAPTYYLSRAARRQVKAVLSGDGGDELFAGYSRYRRDDLVRSARKATVNAYAGGLMRAAAWPMGRRARAATRNLTAGDDYAHYLNVAWFDPDETDGLLCGDVRRCLNGHDPFDVLSEHFARCDGNGELGGLARSQYVDIKTWLADGVLCKVDRASMACGLEVRVPMLDLPLVERMAKLPARMKIRNGRGKYALRRAMEPVLGAAVVNRRKRGFEVPLDGWLTGPLRPLVEDVLFGGETHIAQWLDRKAVNTVWSRLRRGRRGLGPRMWALLMLELWSRSALNGSTRA